MKAIKYIDDYTKHCSNECEGYFHEWVTPDVARGAVRMAEQSNHSTTFETAKAVCLEV